MKPIRLRGLTIDKVKDLIDRALKKKWDDAGIVPAGPAGDGKFLRRVTLDVIGVLPSPDEVIRFLEDNRPHKKSKKIDSLLERPAYAHHWAETWENILIGARTEGRRKARSPLFLWLRDRVFGPNLPADRMAAELIAARGDNRDTGPAAFLLQTLRQGGGAPDMAGRVARTFLSTRIQCAQCHDHPFDNYSQEDFKGMAAFFERTRARRVDPMMGDNSRYELYDSVRGGGDPQFLDGRKAPRRGRRRDALARFVTDPKRPLFAKSMVNRMWARFYGRGIVEPFDDFSSRPSHPALLSSLARGFSAHGHDFKRLIRALANSRAYQLASRVEGDRPPPELFAIASVRPLTPEQSRAVFTRAVGSGIGAFQGTIQQALLLMNGPGPNQGIARGLDPILKASAPAGERLDLIFLTLLSRRPEPTERARLLAHVDSAPNARRGFEDVYWILLNSTEFLFNH